MNSKNLSERSLFKSKILEQDLINHFCKFCNFLPREWAGLVFVMGRSEKLTRDQFTSEHFVWIYQESCYTKGVINRGYKLFNLIKRIFKSVIVILGVIVNQGGSQDELITSEQQGQNLFLLFTNVSVRVHQRKMLKKLRNV